MKKRLLALALILVMPVALAACSGGGSPEGTWTIDLTQNLGTQDFSDLINISGAETYIVSFVLNESGHYLANVGSIHGDHVHDADGDVSGSYTVDEENSTITFDAEHTYTYSISGSTLTITDDAGNTFDYRK